MAKIVRILASLAYYGFARYLPERHSPASLGITKPIRAFLCKFMIEKCGKDVNVERGVVLGYKVKLGDHSIIGADSLLHSGGGINIGSNVMMGRNTTILTQNHRHDALDKPMILQGFEKSPVNIEDDVWIGMRTIILPGVTIGKSSIIGAGAVVTQDIPPFSIAGGCPAKVIRDRRINP